MAVPVTDNLEDLERVRLLLEDNIAKLRKSLQHWQTWDVEYEGLKEELDELPESATKSEIVAAGLAIEGKLVNEKEIKEILGNGPARTPKQVIGLVSRRIDYVEQNIKSIQKQLLTAEEKLDAAIVPSQNGTRSEEGLSLKEIYEELDEDGNVISGGIQHPGDAAPHMLDALKKAGVKDEDLLESFLTTSLKATDVEDMKAESFPGVPAEQPVEKSSKASDPVQDVREVPLHRSRKKSVSFAEGTKEETEHTTSTARSTKPDAKPSSSSSASNTSRLSNLTKGSFTGADRVVELDEYDNPVAVSTPIIPVNESPEDAALRREMLQYSMAEVGNIVAELDIEEDTDSYSDEGYSDGEAEIGSASSGEDEDQYGISTHGTMSEEYRKQMLELEERLNVQMIHNIGPQPTEEEAREELAKGARRLRILSDEHMQGTDISEVEPETVVKVDETMPDKKTKTKGVRFATSLDIAPELPVSDKADAKPARRIQRPATTAVSETITERSLPAARTPSAPTAKPSRFKNARAAASSPSTLSLPPALPSTRRPTGPENAIVAPTLVERAPSTTMNNPPAEPDELDPDVLRQQVAAEYYAQRNRMIQKEGGFMRFREEASETMPDEDEREDQVERVSLFKAARLRRMGEGV